jgi:MFS transporter, DHA1 family, multidrug resistance protein
MLTFAGFAFGPIFWAPLSELKGRRLPILTAGLGLTVFNFGVAVAKDLQTVMICRFFGGFFGSAPLSVVAAVFSDMFDNKSRGLAVTVFGLCVFTGPLMAPFIGGFIVTNHSLGWRWTEYIVGIMVRKLPFQYLVSLISFSAVLPLCLIFCL